MKGKQLKSLWNIRHVISNAAHKKYTWSYHNFSYFLPLSALENTLGEKKRKMSTRIRINPNRCQLREATKPLRGSVSFRLDIGPKEVSLITSSHTDKSANEREHFRIAQKCHRPISDILYRPVSSPPPPHALRTRNSLSTHSGNFSLFFFGSFTEINKRAHLINQLSD